MSIYISVQRRGGDSSAPISTRLFAICIYIKRFYIYEIYTVSSPLRREWERGRGEFDVKSQREGERGDRGEVAVRGARYSIYIMK